MYGVNFLLVKLASTMSGDQMFVIFKLFDPQLRQVYAITLDS